MKPVRLWAFYAPLPVDSESGRCNVHQQGFDSTSDASNNKTLASTDASGNSREQEEYK